MRTFSYWTLLAIGLCCSGRALAEPVAEPEEELAGSEDAADEPTPADEGATDEGLVAEPEATADAEATTTATTDAEAEATAADDDAEAVGCFGEPVAVRRFGEAGELTLRLTDCKGEPNLAALSRLSVLAQPLAADAQPSSDASVKLLNPQLLVRVQRLVEHFPGGGVEIVSGYRPHARPGSRHHSGDALDLHIDGVDNFELSEFARTLDATGVGYYPNSTFVHIDVRDAQAYWIDRSGPGERANYDRKAAAAVLAGDAVNAAASKESDARHEDEPAKDDARENASAIDEATDSATDADTATDTESASEPDTATDTDVDSATPDADLQALAERALQVMNQALGLDDAHGAS